MTRGEPVALGLLHGVAQQGLVALAAFRVKRDVVQRIGQAGHRVGQAGVIHIAFEYLPVVRHAGRARGTDDVLALAAVHKIEFSAHGDGVVAIVAADQIAFARAQSNDIIAFAARYDGAVSGAHKNGIVAPPPMMAL